MYHRECLKLGISMSVFSHLMFSAVTNYEVTVVFQCQVGNVLLVLFS